MQLTEHDAINILTELRLQAERRKSYAQRNRHAPGPEVAAIIMRADAEIEALNLSVTALTDDMIKKQRSA